MYNQCSKLPPINTLENNGNDYSKFIQSAYNIYCEEIAFKHITFNGVPVKTATELDCNLRHQGFEHITTKDTNRNNSSITNVRLYNDKRIERVGWIKHIIEMCNRDCKHYKLFKNIRNSKERTIIWCTREDYVIILEKRRDSYMIITAYCLIYPYAKKKLKKEYEQYIKNQKRPSN